MLYQYLQPTVAGSLFCSRYWMMLVQHDSGERSKLGFIHRWPEMCWVCSLMQTWWPGGSPLWCTSASHCHCVGDRACSCCSTSTFSAPTPWLFGQKVRILHGPSPTLFHIHSAMQGVLIWTANVQLNTTWESQVGCWACCIELAQRTKWNLLFPVSQPWFYSSDLLHVANS